MVQVRFNVFETNSSSTHSITIGDSLPEKLEIPKRLEVCTMDAGRNFCYDSLEERFTFIVVLAEECNRLKDLIEMLNSIGVKEKILAKCDGSNLWCEGAGIGFQSFYEIDSYDAKDYVDEILESKDSLKKWLFSPDSYAFGEDNNY